MLEPAAETSGAPSPQSFRAVLARFATGVSVMTAVADGVPHGMTANAVSSVSLDPPLVLVCVDRSATMAEVVDRSGAFALTFLADDAVQVSQRFADPSRSDGAGQFADVDTFDAATGSPVLKGGHGWVDCRIWDTYAGGDHIIVVGRVVALGPSLDELADPGSASDPLLYHGGSYHRLADRISLEK